MKTPLTDFQFNRLYRENERKLTIIALGYVGDEDTARDIVGDSFTALWESRDKAHEITNIEAYLYQIVKFKCLHYRRNEQFERSVFEKILKKERGLMDFYTKTIESSDPDELLCSEIMDIYRAELERMPRLTREVFIAQKIEGKSYREIAESMNISFKRVDRELQEAATILRRALKDYLAVLVFVAFN